MSATIIVEGVLKEPKSLIKMKHHVPQTANKEEICADVHQKIKGSWKCVTNIRVPKMGHRAAYDISRKQYRDLAARSPRSSSEAWRDDDSDCSVRMHSSNGPLPTAAEAVRRRYGQQTYTRPDDNVRRYEGSRGSRPVVVHPRQPQPVEELHEEPVSSSDSSGIAVQGCPSHRRNARPCVGPHAFAAELHGDEPYMIFELPGDLPETRDQMPGSYPEEW